MAVDWSYFDKFQDLEKKYLPSYGEGETKASQIVTAVSKLIYKYYNDEDIFDNTASLKSYGNDLSGYANWLDRNTTVKTSEILGSIGDCYNAGDYEDLLKELAGELMDEKYLSDMDKIAAVGSIYDCEGIFKYVEMSEDDEEEDW